jgi:hypothetical protein
MTTQLRPFIIAISSALLMAAATEAPAAGP